MPRLIVSTSGSVDQTKCCTPASLAARTAAVACWSSSAPSSHTLVTRNTPCAPSNAALRVSGRVKSAWTTSSLSSLCLAGFRVRARTLNCLSACRARNTAPPCCPVAPTTAISFLLVCSIVRCLPVSIDAKYIDIDTSCWTSVIQRGKIVSPWTRTRETRFTVG